MKTKNIVYTEKNDIKKKYLRNFRKNCWKLSFDFLIQKIKKRRFNIYIKRSLYLNIY